MAEIELNVLMGQCISRRIPEMDTIKTEVKAWQEARKCYLYQKAGVREHWIADPFDFNST